MPHDEADHRSPERRARDEQIAAEPQLPPLKVPPGAVRSTLETYLELRRTRRRATVGSAGATQMIGGRDIAIPTMTDVSALDICARIILRYWPHARFEDATSAEKYADYGQIPMGDVQHLLAYRNAEAEADWDAGDIDAPPNSMLYLIHSPNAVTIVVDNPETGDMPALIESVQGSLEMDILNIYADAA